MVRFGSVCSGIEAASVAFAPFGWEPAWFSEIEPFPCGVLAHHFPEVPNLGDMSDLPAKILSGEVEAPDMLCGGTPCQAFSFAGKRMSLDDARGNLSLTFCEVADAIDSVRNKCGREAAVVFWENVPGVLVTKDNAFGCFLGRLVGADAPLSSGSGRWPSAGAVAGPKRKAAWRVIDAQYFGVPQRRRRVFVVASARDDFDPPQVLFERPCVCGDSPSGGDTREGASHTAEESTGGDGHLWFREGGFGHFRASDTAGTAKACGGMLGGGSETLIVGTLTARDAEKQFANNQAVDSGMLVTLPQAGVRRLTPVECERLQGFPDNWTRIPWRGKDEEKCPDAPRYKAIGNSWAVPCVRWIGERLKIELEQNER